MNQAHKKSVLVIEDSDDIQGLLMVLLQAKGYVIECRSNGEDALNYLNGCACLPDVILLDWRMPIMDGSTFLKLKETFPKLKEIPIIVMTGDEKVEFIQESIDVIIKPLNMKSVLTALERNTSKDRSFTLNGTSQH